MEQRKKEVMDRISGNLMKELRELGKEYRKEVDTLQERMTREIKECASEEEGRRITESYSKKIKELSNQHAKKISEVHQDFINGLIKVAFR